MMMFFSRFRSIDDKDKAAVVRKLMESSTPNFDFFYIAGLSVLMATFGLLANNSAIVIGSMLIAPVLYPILGVSLGLVMSNQRVFRRSFQTLAKALLLGVLISAVATIFFAGDTVATTEVMSRTESSVLYFMVAFVAGLAVAFALGQPEWSETLPGIAIAVALVPPLAVVGIGIAALDMQIVTGSLVLLFTNLFGIILAAMITFSMMNLYEKQNIAESTIKKADQKSEAEANQAKRVEAEVEVQVKEVVEKKTTTRKI